LSGMMIPSRILFKLLNLESMEGLFQH